MIEKITHKKKLFALIVRSKFRKKKGINFFTENNATQQFGYMKHKKDYVIKPHKHNQRLTKILTTTEVIILFKGILRVDFYDNKEKYLFSKKIFRNDIVMLANGGHGFKVLEDVEMLEIKQGPYRLSKDKVKFDNIDEKKIRIK
jgi:hypothetical protein|tara:strand:+ start:1570 stop:2001 length:432 start_codon:yes stop_codon:yes gene_type:complete